MYVALVCSLAVFFFQSSASLRLNAPLTSSVRPRPSVGHALTPSVHAFSSRRDRD